MPICEDAPCCGCCGRSLYGDESVSYDDPYDDVDLEEHAYWDDYEEDPGADEDDAYSLAEDCMMEAGLFGSEA